ncbi:thiamine biosynthesis protein ThiJ [Streptomyces abyssalis]|uniref:Thiamine biosynthesis protein ThiJ n=1 Tax=Streptomyces abyssalis TaxID=933944 RepID=A0A1E7JJW5_9ACTN|nr:type 1 glutamine amidotransferase domain-containing protein [Streptomyces abyssalis]OEU87412.1 thiamine biosynthesis protein ThiJ [Streptomyces abyssalis]OEU87938.1 thiamine biosynthesis protein ThiJ [Streptomyces abyssalis]OEV30052.1 thiamine biosynthesis protein ThiJ [Streptomyces nanshensis]
MAKILMVVSAADSLTLADGTAHPTGYWAEEVVVSHQVLTEAGIDVDIATPGGAQPTVDPISLDERGNVEPGDAKEFRAYLDSLAGQLAKPLALADVTATDYDAVYIPGGHGPMEDLAHDADLGRLLTATERSGKIVAALCHGPAGVLSASGASGESGDTGAGFVFSGRRLTVFSDEEERQGGLGEAVPYFVESRLRDLGAVVETGPAWASKVVADGNLITGQNPQSSHDTARQVVQALKERGSA